MEKKTTNFVFRGLRRACACTSLHDHRSQNSVIPLAQFNLVAVASRRRYVCRIFSVCALKKRLRNAYFIFLSCRLLMPNPPTLEDLLARFKISERQLKDKLSDEHLPAIARLINHEVVGPELGLTQQEMEAIQADGKREEVRRLNTLRKWREKYSFNATYEELLKALLKCQMAEQAEKVCFVLSPLPESMLHYCTKVSSIEIHVYGMPRSVLVMTIRNSREL